MTFPVINSQLTDQLIKALCNTLVHSLWQGLLLAAIAGLIVIFTKRASSALRYNLLIAALLVFTIGTVVTFGLQLQQVHYITANEGVNTAQQNTFTAQTFNGYVNIQPAGFTATITGYLNTYHNSIVLIWFLIICAKSIQLGVGLYGTYRLKRASVFAAGNYWNERMQQLACLLGIRQTISLLESGIAKVPMVIGHLKPVILIPIGLLTALSAEEVEAILVHELAHIKRRDYLVNMLQSLMEIIFFFNPAVLWLSQLIKTERENCCDDMALEQSSNKVNYIRALVSCEEYQAAVPAYAMAFPGSKNSLLDRVKRLATNRNNSLNLYEKTLLCVCLVISGLCVSAFAEKENIRKAVHEVVKVFQHKGLNPAEQQKLIEQTNLLKAQTEKIRQNTALLTANSPQLQIVDDTNKKVKLNVAPVSITAPLIPQINVGLQPLNMSLTSLNVSMQPMRVMLPIFSLLGDYDYGDTTKKVQVSNVNLHLDPLNVQLSNVSVNANVDVHSDVRSNVSLGKLEGPLGKVDTNNRSRNLYKNTFHEIGRELFKMHVLTDTNHMSINLNERLLIVNGVKQPEETHRIIFEKFGKKGNLNGYEGANSNGNYNSYSNSYAPSNSASSSNAYSNSYSSGYGLSASLSGKSNSNSYSGTNPNSPTPKYSSPKTPAYPDQEKNDADVKKILADLEKDGLIANRNHISFQISNKEFILNGKKQSDEIFQKYKKKYYPQQAGDSWTWSHSYNNDTTPE